MMLSSDIRTAFVQAQLDPDKYQSHFAEVNMKGRSVFGCSFIWVILSLGLRSLWNSSSEILSDLVSILGVITLPLLRTQITYPDLYGRRHV